MAIKKRFLPPIPEGYQIYYGSEEVAGVYHRKNDVIAFIKGNDHELNIRSEPSNSADKNAIAIYGTSKGFFFRRTRKIGYVPAKVSAEIARNNEFQSLLIRIRGIFLGDTDYCNVIFDLLGPKIQRKKTASKNRKSTRKKTPKN